jgi:hypothetical protein
MQYFRMLQHHAADVKKSSSTHADAPGTGFWAAAHLQHGRHVHRCHDPHLSPDFHRHCPQLQSPSTARGSHFLYSWRENVQWQATPLRPPPSHSSHPTTLAQVHLRHPLRAASHGCPEALRPRHPIDPHHQHNYNRLPQRSGPADWMQRSIGSGWGVCLCPGSNNDAVWNRWLGAWQGAPPTHQPGAHSGKWQPDDEEVAILQAGHMQGACSMALGC